MSLNNFAFSCRWRCRCHQTPRIAILEDDECYPTFWRVCACFGFFIHFLFFDVFVLLLWRIYNKRSVSLWLQIFPEHWPLNHRIRRGSMKEAAPCAKPGRAARMTVQWRGWRCPPGTKSLKHPWQLIWKRWNIVSRVEYDIDYFLFTLCNLATCLYITCLLDWWNMWQ